METLGRVWISTDGYRAIRVSGVRGSRKRVPIARATTKPPTARVCWG